MIHGICAHVDEIDNLLADHSHNWRVERMSLVDRNILRIAVFELLHERETPVNVVIDEAVNLAANLSTDESPGFINGLLGRIAALRERIAPIE